MFQRMGRVVGMCDRGIRYLHGIMEVKEVNSRLHDQERILYDGKIVLMDLLIEEIRHPISQSDQGSHGEPNKVVLLAPPRPQQCGQLKCHSWRSNVERSFIRLVWPPLLFEQEQCIASDLPKFANAAQEWGLSTAFEDDATSFADFFDILTPRSMKCPVATIGLLHGVVEVLKEDADTCSEHRQIGLHVTKALN